MVSWMNTCSVTVFLVTQAVRRSDVAKVQPSDIIQCVTGRRIVFIINARYWLGNKDTSPYPICLVIFARMNLSDSDIFFLWYGNDWKRIISHP